MVGGGGNGYDGQGFCSWPLRGGSEALRVLKKKKLQLRILMSKYIYIHVSQPCSRTLPTMVTALSRRSCFLIFSRLQPLQLPPIHLCLSSNRHSWLNVPKFVLVAPRTIDLCYNSWQPLCVCNFLTVGHRSDMIGGNTHTDTHTFGAQVHSTSTYK